MTEKQTADLDMIASGALSPLVGFMAQADYDRMVEKMQLAGGLPWALPVTPGSSRARHRRPLALEGYEGDLLAVIDVAEVFEADRAKHEAEKVSAPPRRPIRASRRSTPRATTSSAAPSRCSSAPSPPSRPQRSTPRTTRAAFEERGWNRVVGFQTRNPVHRAHEYLQKCALETVDGLLLHPLVGETKGDDIPADVRMRCYQVLLDELLPGRPHRARACSRPRCATPGRARRSGTRSCRKNYGCTHFIVGRDHAGVGNYYGTYDAHHIFDEFEPRRARHRADVLRPHVLLQDVRRDGLEQDLPAPAEDHVFLRGTKVREMLGAGEIPPVEFSRPEVAEVLIGPTATRARATRRLQHRVIPVLEVLAC